MSLEFKYLKSSLSSEKRSEKFDKENLDFPAKNWIFRVKKYLTGLSRSLSKKFREKIPKNWWFGDKSSEKKKEKKVRLWASLRELKTCNLSMPPNRQLFFHSHNQIFQKRAKVVNKMGINLMIFTTHSCFLVLVSFCQENY